MSTSNISAASREIKSLINEAERMLTEASSATGERAEELKKQSLKLMSSGMAKANELERLVIDSSKALATSTDLLVHESPWKAMAISGVIGAGIGLALGAAMGRK